MQASAPSTSFYGNPAPGYIRGSSVTVQLVNQKQEPTLLFQSTASSAATAGECQIQIYFLPLHTDRSFVYLLLFMQQAMCNII